MNIKLLPCAALLLLPPLLSSCATNNPSTGLVGMATPMAKDKTIKVLFLGNSYTDGIQATFRQVLSASPYQNSVFDFRWGGGATLSKLIRNGRAFRCIEQQEWDYVGKGVKLGQADEPVFWHRPAGSEKCRVIYGDLSIKEVSPEMLKEVVGEASAAGDQ